MTVPIEVSDKIANLNDHIANAAKAIGCSPERKKVFQAIYYGKKKIKSRDEIANATGLSKKRVLELGKTLVNNHIVSQVKIDQQVGYEKNPFYGQYKKRILGYVDQPARLNSLPTKVRPIVSNAGVRVNVSFPTKTFDIEQITVDDVASFKAVQKIQDSPEMVPIDEKKFKEGIKRIIGEKGMFIDWGGERNDLFTTKVRIGGKRYACAFAFKGKGLTGILKPNRMGKNGDQIQRLFQSNARVFIVQYWGQIDESIYDLMKCLAISRSALYREKVFYCVIDGFDTARIGSAYKNIFK